MDSQQALDALGAPRFENLQEALDLLKTTVAPLNGPQGDHLALLRALATIEEALAAEPSIAAPRT